MADNRLNWQQVTRTGLVATYAVAGASQGQLNTTDTYKVNNDGRIQFHWRNAGVASITVTIDTPHLVDGDLAIAQRTIVIAAGEERFSGVYAPSEYNQPGTHDLQFTLSGVSGLTVAILRS